MARCQSSRVAARKPLAGGPPALVTQISTLPNLAATAATKLATAAGSATSKASAKTSASCCLRIFSAAACRVCSVACAHGDAAAFGGEGFGGGQAESLAGRGYQGYAVFQAEVHGLRLRLIGMRLWIGLSVARARTLRNEPRE